MHIYRNPKSLVAVAVIALALPASAVFADTLELKDGTTLEGKVLGKFKSKGGQTIMFNGGTLMR